MLGLDPLEVGNEGKIVIGVVPGKAEQMLNWLKQTTEGKDAEIIGEVTSEFKVVAMQTAVGGKRIIASRRPRPKNLLASPSTFETFK